MKQIVVNMQLSVPDNISSEMIDAYFADVESNIESFLGEELNDEEVRLDVYRVYEK